jgi:hypothetical protein
MSFEEKNSWAFLFIAVTGYTVYLVLLFGAAVGGPVWEVDYAPFLFWTIGGAIVAGIVLGILLGMVTRQRDRGDQRDREINAFGERIGNSFIVIGALAGMLFAVFQVDYFWIANVIYLCFVLSALLSSVAKLVAYRKGLPTW